MTSPTPPYLRDWHRRHAVCPGWAAASDLAAAVGPRPEGHVLALLHGDLAVCGACRACRGAGVGRNAEWIVGERGGRATVLHEGVRMTRAAAAERIGISRQALAARLMREGDPMRPRTG